MRQAVILAGGLGTRIAPVAAGLPKVLLPVGGRPFLHHLMDRLTAGGISEIVLLLGHRADEVAAAARAGAGPGLRLLESVEHEPLGTGGALKAAESWLDQRFLVLNGDTLLDLDLADLVSAHKAAAPTGAVATLALVRHPRAGQKGLVRLGRDGEIVEFVEKGRDGPGLINAGVYCVERRGLAMVPARRAVSLEREVFPLWMKEAGGRGLQGFVVDAYFVDIGLPEDYLGVKDGFPKSER